MKSEDQSALKKLFGRPTLDLWESTEKDGD